MRTTIRFGLMLSAIVLLALPHASASEMTVGRFLQRLAEARQLAAPDPATAVESLRAAGVMLPARLDYAGPLTEGEVVRLTRAMGLNVRTSRPEEAYDDRQVDTLFLVFGEELGLGDAPIRDTPLLTSGDGSDGPPFDPASKGNKGGKGKGKYSVTPTEP